MSAERVIANTLRLAQDDLDAAKLLHAGKNRYAVYHCEQAAEKIIKAVLTSEGVHANIKHQLDDMVKQVPDTRSAKACYRSICRRPHRCRGLRQSNGGTPRSRPACASRWSARL